MDGDPVIDHHPSAADPTHGDLRQTRVRLSIPGRSWGAGSWEVKFTLR